MSVAITGATGFLGRYVVNALLEEDHDILVVGRSAPTENKRVIFFKTDFLKKKYYWNI